MTLWVHPSLQGSVQLMDWLFFIQLKIITHQLSFYPNSNALLHVERFKIICLLCHLGGMAEMELVELQCNDELKAKFYNSSPLSFRDIALPSKNFPKYIAHVQRIVAMFGGTYCCEQLFSKMKYTKSRLEVLLSGRHLNGINSSVVELIHRA